MQSLWQIEFATLSEPIQFSVTNIYQTISTLQGNTLWKIHIKTSLSLSVMETLYTFWKTKYVETQLSDDRLSTELTLMFMNWL